MKDKAIIGLIPKAGTADKQNGRYSWNVSLVIHIFETTALASSNSNNRSRGYAGRGY